MWFLCQKLNSMASLESWTLHVFANRAEKLLCWGFFTCLTCKISLELIVSGCKIFLVSFGNPVGVIAIHLNELLLKWLKLHSVGGLITALLCLLYQLQVNSFSQLWSCLNVKKPFPIKLFTYYAANFCQQTG